MANRELANLFSFTREEAAITRESPHEKVTCSFELWREPIYRYLISIGAGPAEAEELAQESFLRLFRQLRSGETVDNTPNWLFRVARNLWIDRSRSDARVSVLEDFDFSQACERYIDPNPSAEQVLLERERMQMLHAAMNGLTAHQRECLFLRAQGFSHREIAGIMGIATSSASDLLRRAVQRLSKEFCL